MHIFPQRQNNIPASILAPAAAEMFGFDISIAVIEIIHILFIARPYKLGPYIQ